MASPSRKLTSVCLAVIVLLALTATIFRKLEIPSSRKLKTEELRSAKNNSTMAAKRVKGVELNEQHAVSDPDRVADEVASLVQMSEHNKTARRKLGFFSCGTGNPIDDCWRCDPNWHKNRKRLADCGIGFGRNAIGGRDGRFYIVTDPTDDDVINPKPGTLRHAVIQEEPLWIVFRRDMVIELKQELIMNSADMGISMWLTTTTHTGRCMPLVGVQSQPSTVKETDMLLLSIVSPRRFNFFKNPLFFAETEVGTDASDWKKWNWRSEGDLLLNGAFFRASGAGTSASYGRASSLAAKPSSMVRTITSTAGALGHIPLCFLPGGRNLSTSACFFFFYKKLGIQRGASTEALFKRFLSFLDYKSLMGFGFGVVKVPMVLMDLTPLSSRVFLGFLFQVIGALGVTRTQDLTFNNTPPPDQLVTACLVGELLKGEVLGSSNAKRINNLPVDVEAFPPTVKS
ncbi:hypothetical protein YC2023_094137 [Brassica napus]